ncbi:MAG TPA: DNA polymerase IV, partial [Firmicutes bacterium]|nr:DNA polymerase IV [Bacillota bacterium]
SGSTHLFGNGKEIADRIRKEVREELGLTISVGVSFNKVFAKLGSDYKKPDATTVIDRKNFREIIYPLPVTALLFVGKAAADCLSKLGIKTIGQLAASNKDALIDKLGRLGETIHDYANGLDEDPVASAHAEREIKSIGNGMTFKRNLLGMADIITAVSSLADLVASRLRKSGFKCTTVQVVIKDPRLKTISRQKSLPQATYLSREISDAAAGLIKDNWDLKKPIRMLNITGLNLVAESQPEQASLFFEEDEEKREKIEKIETTLDYIRERYGKKSISFGSNLFNDLGLSASETDKEKD